ncbi:MAG: hypothetical protein CK527_02805 [Nitrosarchaeum sp.]|nr:hypothetical protein [Nitrosarchaeum sp.]PHY09540.1 MAG: hypothetical protein CK527_02805 [Nitrosarchaeum sp.]
MKNSYYFLIPLIALIVILFNAFFGHLLFTSPYDQDINKYSIYIHLQPEWNSYPGNILFDVTNVWSNQKSNVTGFGYDSSDTTMFSDYNSNQLHYQKQKSFVELKHEFSNCESSWNPHLYRYAVDSIRSNIESLQGIKLNNDPYVSIYKNIPNEKYSLEKQKELVKSGYVQFIPICTLEYFTSYEFGISIDDENTFFDAYFIPSEIELNHYLDNNSFIFYDQPKCFTINHNSFSGICNNVTKNSGLLVIIPDNLKLSLTKIKISLHEKLLN